MVHFGNFLDLREFSRRYNSTAMLEIGSIKCWNNWNQPNALTSWDWVNRNAERHYTIRLMLLASLSNPHRHGKVSIQDFDKLVNAYHNLGGHTIFDTDILHNEAKNLLNSVTEFENQKQYERYVRNSSLKLSNILNLELLRRHMPGLFIQRLGAFQNAGFRKPSAQITRIVKIISFLDERPKEQFSKKIKNDLGLSLEHYFQQYLSCLVLFDGSFQKTGFFRTSHFPKIDMDLQGTSITEDNIKCFIQGNSSPFTLDNSFSFRGRVQKDLGGLPVYYQPFLYNFFLSTPFVELKDEEFCLPDPFSLLDSTWNQIAKIRGEDLSLAFENYIEKILLPFIAAGRFERIPEIKNSTSQGDKRADFLIETSNSYILIECKNSLMSADTGAYFQAEKIASLWWRIHIAVEQIKSTVIARELYDKPVIPLVITFYDSTAAAAVFRESLKQTDYCDQMKINVEPVVHSLHEFEHWLSDRSIDNWAQLILAQQEPGASVESDMQGHAYKHLENFSLFYSMFKFSTIRQMVQ
jgi:hypothetical protein